MAQLTFTQIEQLWIRNGGTQGWAPLMAGIAMAESGGNTQAFNTDPATMDRSVGLWQINYYGNLYTSRAHSYGTPTHLLSTPNAQAKAAVSLSTNGRNLSPWQTDPTWNAWQAAGRPFQPSSSTVQSWVHGAQAALSSAVVSAQEGVAAATAATAAAAAATPSTKGLPVPTQGEQYAFRGERTFSIVTPSVVPGISATPPTAPHFGLNPIGDLATALRFSTSFGGWALMTAAVFVLGFALLTLGLIMLLMILFGPVTDKVLSVAGPGKAARALSPGRRAQRIESRTRLATAKAKRATRNEATAQYKAAGGAAGVKVRTRESQRIRERHRQGRYEPFEQPSS